MWNKNLIYDRITSMRKKSKKKISIVLPCFNEQDNIIPISEELIKYFDNELKAYDYELLFIDNNSSDLTRDRIKELCKKNKKIKAIFNLKNFGQFNSPFYGLINSSGDASILMATDFQDPPKLILDFVKYWEEGYEVVVGVKDRSYENFIIKSFKKLYYSLIKRFSDADQVKMFTGFGLYDKAFVDILKNLNDPTPFLRGLVAEYAPHRKEVKFKQGKRRAGKSSNTFYTLYDAAMLSFTSYTKIGLRVATFVGFFFSFVFMLIALIYLVLKLIYWDRFAAGQAPLLIGMLFLGSIQIFFIGLLGEYVLSINQRIMHRPIVIEKERINFEV